ncbi:MAG: hydrogen gas-evolving membrane-bound hydrogenase subunit E [Pseudomonadota bacterium]|nr:hydrogen gas-evolving membrane-bound hydrogenase subunit E [Pseudomonadota bacterium]
MKNWFKMISLIAVIMTGALLIYGTHDMPAWGDPDSPPNSHVSPRYILEATKLTATPNIVSAVLADYRSYDTLGESAVIFTASISCLFLLRRVRKEKKGRGQIDA